MANKWPLANGNWSNAANWNDGTKPQAGDTVYADGKTVTIDEDATVESVRTTQRSGGTAGGGFTLANGVTLTADAVAGTTTCVSTSANSAIIGNATGGSGPSAYGAYNNSTGTLTITGNVTGGSASNVYGAYNYSTGTLTITGNVTGGSASYAYGAFNNSTGTLTITGNATGGSGPSAYGAFNNSTGTLTITGLAVGSEYGNGSVGYSLTAGVFGSQNGNTTVGGFKFGNRGLSPASGNVFVADFAAATCYVRRSDFTEGVLVDSASINNPPAVTDVRAGVTYTTGGVLTGTLAVPAAGSVALGVPVDNTSGTAVLSQQAVRDAMKLAPSAGAAAEGSIDAALSPGVNVISIGGTSVSLTDALDIETIEGEDATDAIQAAAAAAIAAASLSTYDGSDTAGVTTLLTRILGTIASGTHTPQSGDSYPTIAAISAELAKVPKSDGTATWNDTALASINAEVSSALSAADLPQLIEDAVEAGLTPYFGPGADSVTLNFITDDGDAIPDADVWVTADAAGEVLVQGTLQTDSSGNATFRLDNGNTYYAWLQKDGVNPLTGVEFVAEADPEPMMASLPPAGLSPVMTIV